MLLGSFDVWAAAFSVLDNSPTECSIAAGQAMAKAEQDWGTECRIFARAVDPDALENWAQAAWRDPWAASVDTRSTPQHTGPCFDVALYGDGGFFSLSGASFAAQPRFFGGTGHNYEESSPAENGVASRVPPVVKDTRTLHDTTVHVVEFAAMVCALSWRQLGESSHFVGDRSAHFQVMERLASRPPQPLTQGACILLEARLRRIALDLRGAW